MKFGGTSLQNAACITRAVRIVERHRRRLPLVVVSAVGSVTRALLQLGSTALARGAAAGRAALREIETEHREILDDLQFGSEAGGSIGEQLGRYIGELAGTVDSIVANGEYTPQMQDAVISFGERLSTLLFVAAARQAGLDAVKVDAATVMITDDRFRQARPDREELRRRAAGLIGSLLDVGSIPVTEGFIGATIDGVPTTMGFEASDYSATLLGASLGADAIQIWTDVPGMLTTGHPAVAHVSVVPKLSFEEAQQLAAHGAKVLHPDTVAPAREADIPIQIRYSKEPDAPGTLISAAAAGPGVKAIAVREDVAGERTIVCPVGEGIAAAGEAERMAAFLEGMPFELVETDSSSSLPISVPCRCVAATVRRLHEAYFETATFADPHSRAARPLAV